MKIYTDQPTPALYEISAPTTQAFQINVFEPACQYIVQILENDAPKVTIRKGELLIESDSSMPIGVKGVIAPGPDPSPGWKSFHVLLNVFRDRKSYTQETGYRISTCVSLFLRSLGAVYYVSPDEFGDTQKLQLVRDFGFAVEMGMGRCALGCWLMPSFVSWLKNNAGKRFDQVADRVVEAFGWTKADAFMGGNAVWIENDGRPIITCPGNACDFAVYPYGIDLGEDRPKEMHSHNVDSPMQQLSLLYGLACLHDLARADGH